MKYRTFGKTGEDVSVLGFETIYLPQKNWEINIEKSTEILKYGIENGINIIDTAYSYPSFKSIKNGCFEKFIGEFLIENSYKDDVFISTKLPSHLIHNKEDMEQIFQKQLKNLQTDCIDFYQLQNLDEKYWNMYKSIGIFEFMDNLLEEDKIKHIGFSTNTEMDMIVDITDDYDKWEFGESELSYITERYQSGLEGVEYLYKLGLGVMIQEPLRGGALIENIPNDIKELWDLIEDEKSPVELAFDYLYNKKEISTVISGMKTIEEVKENIEIASKSEIDCINQNDQNLIREIVWEYKLRKGNDCTECTHCMPCPEGVDIPACFREYNIAKSLNNPKASAMQYLRLEDKSRADNCIHCKDCLRFCTQMINISDDLEKVEEFFKDFKD